MGHLLQHFTRLMNLGSSPASKNHHIPPKSIHLQIKNNVLVLQHRRALDVSARDTGSAITLSLLPRSNRSWAALAGGSAFVWKAHKKAVGRLCCESASPGRLGDVKGLYCAVNTKLHLFKGNRLCISSLSVTAALQKVYCRMDGSPWEWDIPSLRSGLYV